MIFRFCQSFRKVSCESQKGFQTFRFDKSKQISCFYSVIRSLGKVFHALLRRTFPVFALDVRYKISLDAFGIV
jgi:hypothetical protein